MDRKVRVLIAKPGLDGHDRGAKVISYSLRDAGIEVIYSGLRQSPDTIVRSAIQEDVDVVGLSILSGAHLSLTQRIADGLKRNGGEDIGIMVGGTIPEEDIPDLKKMGVFEVFTSGANMQQIIDAINQHVGAVSESG